MVAVCSAAALLVLTRCSPPRWSRPPVGARRRRALAVAAHCPARPCRLRPRAARRAGAAAGAPAPALVRRPLFRTRRAAAGRRSKVPERDGGEVRLGAYDLFEKNCRAGAKLPRAAGRASGGAPGGEQRVADGVGQLPKAARRARLPAHHPARPTRRARRAPRAGLAKPTGASVPPRARRRAAPRRRRRLPRGSPRRGRRARPADGGGRRLPAASARAALEPAVARRLRSTEPAARAPERQRQQ